MTHKILIILLLTPAALVPNADSLQADIGYTSDNDRFDMTGMFKANDKVNSEALVNDEGDRRVASELEYRRLQQHEDTQIPLSDENLMKPPVVYFLARRADNVPYDPDEDHPVGRAGGIKMMDIDFEENLKQFMELPKTRRKRN